MPFSVYVYTNVYVCVSVKKRAFTRISDMVACFFFLSVKLFLFFFFIFFFHLYSSLVGLVFFFFFNNNVDMNGVVVWNQAPSYIHVVIIDVVAAVVFAVCWKVCYAKDYAIIVQSLCFTYTYIQIHIHTNTHTPNFIQVALYFRHPNQMLLLLRFMIIYYVWKNSLKYRVRKKHTRKFIF